MATITKPILTDETGQAIVAALEQQGLSITDATGQDIVTAINTLSASTIHTSDIIDNLTSNSSIAPLSAKQGKALKELIDTFKLSIFPVGSILISGSSENPSSVMGGTWTLENERYLVEKYQYGSYWYNWYSDGWIEQGSNFGTAFSSWTTQTITFMKPFKNANYCVQAMTGHTSSTDSPCINLKTPTYFTCTPYNSSGNGNWFACGYGATPKPTRWYWKRIA